VIPSIRPRAIHRVLAGLREHGLLTDTIVVDDTVDGAVARSTGREIAQTLRSGGVGPGAARNIGASEARADWLLFLDDDVTLPTGFGDAVRSALGGCPPSTGLIECAVRPVGRGARPYWRYRLIESRTQGAFLTACLLVRRDVLLRVGGFSGLFRRAFREDTDLGIRIIESGVDADWAPSLYVLHPLEQLSARRFLATATLFLDDAEFRRRHPRYLGSVGQHLRVGPVRIRGLRRRLSLFAVIGCLVAAALRRPWLIIGCGVSVGAALNTVHLRALRRAGCAEPSLVDIVRLQDVFAHTAWGLIAGAAQAAGFARLFARNVHHSTPR
jgi:Glycosyl transferase family 2